MSLNENTNANTNTNTILVDSSISCVALSPDGKYMGFVSEGNKASVWDVKEYTEVSNFDLGVSPL